MHWIIFSQQKMVLFSPGTITFTMKCNNSSSNSLNFHQNLCRCKQRKKAAEEYPATRKLQSLCGQDKDMKKWYFSHRFSIQLNFTIPISS